MALIAYRRHGDYFLPNIVLNEPPREQTEPIGRYGRLRREYLREHRSIRYNTLLLSERLFPHLRDLDETTNERRSRGVSEEVILNELVYE